MKKAILICLCLISNLILAQTNSENHTVQVSAIVNDSVPSITLSWNPVEGANKYSIFRKSPSSKSWGIVLEVLPDSIHQYIDTNIQIGVPYEYRILSNRGSLTPTNAYGFLLSGIEVPAMESRGGIILAVDSSLLSYIPEHIETLKLDLIGDGWTVHELILSPNDSVPYVKSKIQDLHAADPSIKSLYLLGDLAVPYSGLIGPDGHGNHIGAWPADGFYGDMDNVWTDQFINDVSASRAANKNIPNDGKYDQSYFPTSLELSVGRVDLANMPAFDSSYIALTKAYLEKSNRFKHHTIYKPLRALCDDNFASFAEGFARNGWGNFGPLVGKENILKSDFLGTLDTAEYYNYLWSYGCGGGTYTSANGIGNTGRFASESPKGTFSMLFGSYFGDWDSQNNFLRAPLASSGTILTNVWAGRPNWYFHRMGLGETIGKSHVLSQNDKLDSPVYPINSHGVGGVHTALMGDPSLRMNYIDSPKRFTASGDNKQLQIQWSPSTDPAVEGYHLYTSSSQFGQYERINDSLIQDTTWTISCLKKGDYYLMLRPLKLQTTASGSYYNLGTGVFTSVEIVDTLITLDYNISVQNPDCEFDPDGVIQVTAENGAFPIDLSWNTGDTSANLNNLDAGLYSLTITDAQNCIVVDSVQVDVIDTIAPILICPDDIIVNGCDLSIAYDPVMVIENCAVSHGTSEIPYQSGDIFPVGTTEFNHTIFDTHGNSASCSFSVTLLSTEVEINNEAVEHPKCYESADGSISFEVENGTLPITYSWNPDIGNIAVVDSLQAGFYSVLVSDAVNCKDSAIFQLLPPDSISILIDTIIHTTSGNTDGSIRISVNGGTSPYSIQWYDRWGTPIGNGTELNNLASGCYILQIIDENGCTKNESFCVQELVSVETARADNFRIELYPSPAKNHLTLKGIEKIGRIENLQIWNTSGQLVQRQTDNYTTFLDIERLISGHYVLQIVSEKGVFNMKFVKQ